MRDGDSDWGGRSFSPVMMVGSVLFILVNVTLERLIGSWLEKRNLLGLASAGRIAGGIDSCCPWFLDEFPEPGAAALG